jgi:hypothetical protein
LDLNRNSEGIAPSLLQGLQFVGGTVIILLQFFR